MTRELASWFAQNVAWAIFGLLLIPYLMWGVYALRHTLIRGAVLRPRIEAITLAALVIFFAVEFHLLSLWLGNRQLQLLFAAFCLFASGLALYGPMAVSLATHVLVDQVMPAHKHAVEEPDYGAGEACERLGDFDRAAEEYAVVARMFPQDSTASLRTADNLMKLSRPEEAVEWFERGLSNLDSPERSLSISNRLFEIYRTRLNQPEKARGVLQAYLDKFPDAEYAHSVRARLDRLDDSQPPAESDSPPLQGPPLIDD
jgi:tetratricopeptide (TPR) repeat protein